MTERDLLWNAVAGWRYVPGFCPMHTGYALNSLIWHWEALDMRGW